MRVCWRSCERVREGGGVSGVGCQSVRCQSVKLEVACNLPPPAT